MSKKIKRGLVKKENAISKNSILLLGIFLIAIFLVANNHYGFIENFPLTGKTQDDSPFAVTLSPWEDGCGILTIINPVTGIASPATAVCTAAIGCHPLPSALPVCRTEATLTICLPEGCSSIISACSEGICVSGGDLLLYTTLTILHGCRHGPGQNDIYFCGDTIEKSCNATGNISQLSDDHECFLISRNNLIIDGKGFDIIKSNPSPTTSIAFMVSANNTTITNWNVKGFDIPISITPGTINNKVFGNSFPEGKISPTFFPLGMKNKLGETELLIESFTGNIELTPIEKSTYRQSLTSLIPLEKNLFITNSTPGYVYIRIYYNSDEVSDLGIEEETLKLYKINATNKALIPVENSGVNLEQKYVFANITKFSEFGIFGEEEEEKTPLSVGLINPLNNYFNDSASPFPVFFRCSFSDEFNVTNITLFIFQNNSIKFSNALQINAPSGFANWTVSLINGNYTWNCLAYNKNSESKWGVLNRSFSINHTVTATPVTTQNQTTPATDTKIEVPSDARIGERIEKKSAAGSIFFFILIIVLVFIAILLAYLLIKFVFNKTKEKHHYQRIERHHIPTHYSTANKNHNHPRKY